MQKILLLLTIVLSTTTQAEGLYKFVSEKSTRTFEQSVFQLNADQNLINEVIPQLQIVSSQSNLDSFGEWKYIGENHLIKLDIPQDSPNEFNPTWALKSVSAVKAWEITKGKNIVVAVSDTGVSKGNPALEPAMWINPGESGFDSQGKDKRKNGIDDDGNGYTDDVHGWNFVLKRNSGQDNHYHGTHVAGIIAARASKNFSGVAPEASIMDVSFLTSKGDGTIANAVKTLVYATDMGAHLINCSWGGSGESTAVAEAIQYAQSKGVLVVAAAGNNSRNNDTSSFYPATIDLANIVSVGAVTSANGTRARFSNYGHKTVELAAPGANILSTAPSSGSKAYKTLSGTSMAAPHVAGTIALMLSLYPGLSWQEIKSKLMDSVTPHSYWKKKSISGGTLNSAAALK